MANEMQDSFFQSLSAETGARGISSAAASARLKSKIYSALIGEMQESGPLLDVSRTEATHRLCVFEKLVQITPLPEGAGTFNACSVCHARLLAERLERAPIYWNGCPYVGFQGR